MAASDSDPDRERDDGHRPDGIGRDLLSVLAGVDLNLLVPLHALLEERSVTRAARRVGISQPAMSHALQRCRKLLCDELLVRVGPSYEPTPRGRQLVEPLAAIMRTVDEVVLDNGGFDPALAHRTFRISATTTTALVVVPPLIRRLEEHAPGVAVDVVASILPGESLLDMPGIDVALLADTVPSDLTREPLYEDEWVVLVDPGNEAVTDRVTIDHLAQLPHVVFHASPMRLPLVAYSHLSQLGVAYTVRARVNDFLLVPFLLRGTDMVALVQRRVASSLAAAGLVRMFPLPYPVPRLRIDMVWNPRRASDPGARWLRAQLLAVIAEDHSPRECGA